MISIEYGNSKPSHNILRLAGIGFLSRVVTCMTLVVGTLRHLGKTRKGGRFCHQDSGMVSVSNLKSKLHTF